MFAGVEHVAIASFRPEALAQWYVDHLNFRHLTADDRTYFVQASNGAVLEIIPSEGERPQSSMHTAGFRHMAISVNDFEGAYAGLRSGGVQFLGDPYSSPQGNRVVFFTDCEGNILHLIQRLQPLAGALQG
jgi:glyoxylase I family protein